MPCEESAGAGADEKAEGNPEDPNGPPCAKVEDVSGNTLVDVAVVVDPPNAVPDAPNALAAGGVWNVERVGGLNTLEGPPPGTVAIDLNASGAVSERSLTESSRVDSGLLHERFAPPLLLGSPLGAPLPLPLPLPRSPIANVAGAAGLNEAKGGWLLVELEWPFVVAATVAGWDGNAGLNPPLHVDMRTGAIRGSTAGEVALLSSLSFHHLVPISAPSQDYPTHRHDRSQTFLAA